MTPTEEEVRTVTTVHITDPAPDGNGTSIVINGVEMRDHIRAGGITVQWRDPGFPPLVTLVVPADELTLVVPANVQVQAPGIRPHHPADVGGKV